MIARLTSRGEPVLVNLMTVTIVKIIDKRSTIKFSNGDRLIVEEDLPTIQERFLHPQREVDKRG